MKQAKQTLQERSDDKIEEAARWAKELENIEAEPQDFTEEISEAFDIDIVLPKQSIRYEVTNETIGSSASEWKRTVVFTKTEHWGNKMGTRACARMKRKLLQQQAQRVEQKKMRAEDPRELRQRCLQKYAENEEKKAKKAKVEGKNETCDVPYF